MSTAESDAKERAARDESDAKERDARDVINCIPVVNIAYNAVRAAVHGVRGDDKEVARSCYDMTGAALAVAPMVAGPFGLIGSVAGGVMLSQGDKIQKQSKR